VILFPSPFPLRKRKFAGARADAGGSSSSSRRAMASWIGTFVFVAFFGASLPARGELVVIANPQNGVDQLTRSQIVNIFMGNHREFPNGLRARPFDLPADNPGKERFYHSLVNKDLNQMAAYWSRLVFAGSTTPPVQAKDPHEVIQVVAGNRNAIGYVERESVNSACANLRVGNSAECVKIVYALP
jgi:ABC-type phosphate transport system substrate-binding protein